MGRHRKKLPKIKKKEYPFDKCGFNTQQKDPLDKPGFNSQQRRTMRERPVSVLSFRFVKF